MASTTVFRKVALDRLASPEQLDQLMQVTDARGWIALIALGAVLLAAIVWSIVGSIPEQVAGEGILVKSGGLYEVFPSAAGRVADIAVSVGDSVTEGEVVARIEQPQLADQVAQSKAALAALEQQYQQLLTYGARDQDLQTRLLTQQRATTQESIAHDEQSAKWLQEKIVNQQQLVTDGLLTKETLLDTRQQFDQLQEQLSNQRSQLTQFAVNVLKLKNQRIQDLRDAQNKIADQQRQLAGLQRQYREGVEVVAPYTGRILEIMAERGDIVASGQPILSLDLTGRQVQDLIAVLYVPSGSGKQIKVGMPVQIAPSTVKQDEYGLMLGRVTYVSDFPATTQGMTRVLKNSKLVTALSGQDAPYEVHADLLVDPGTVSRYRWSSSSGPPQRIESGTIAVGNIAVSVKRPIELVIPLIHQYTGI